MAVNISGLQNLTPDAVGMADGAGNTYGFVKGSRPGSIFNTVEYPALINNPDVTNVFTEIFYGGG